MLLEKTARQICDLVGGKLIGNTDTSFQGVAALSEARDCDVAFLGNDKYISQVLPSRSALVLVPPEFEQAPPEGRAWIVCDSPSEAFSKVVALFMPPPEVYAPGVHSSAVISPDAQVPASVHIAAGVVIEAGAVIGENTVLMANVYVGRKAVLGADCLIYPNVTIRERCLLGNRVILHAGVVIGSDGFGYKSTPEGHEKIPQVGIVQIDDDVEIGANSCVDRARFGRTWVKRGSKLDNLVQVGHNCEIGENAMIVAQVGIAGSCKLGKGVILAGQAGISGHLDLGDGSIVMGQAGVSKNLEPGAIVIGSPAMDRREFARQQLQIGRISKINEQLKALQKELEELKNNICK